MASESESSGIRPFERSDAMRAAACISGQRSPARFAAFLEEVFIDNPWADPEIPSLIYVEDGEIVGTLMVSTRKMRFEDKEIRVAVSAFFWTHPKARSRGVGPRLLRAALAGPQDMAITDGATDEVRQMWEMLGGRTSHLRCFTFLRLLKPWQFGAGRITGDRSSATVRRSLDSAAQALDHLTVRTGRFKGEDPPVGCDVEPLTPETLVASLDVIAARTPLRSAYDERYLEWLFARLDSLDDTQPYWLREKRGWTWAERAFDKRRPIGWYVCQISPRGTCRVLQLVAADRDVSSTFRLLVRGAAERGAAAVVGRVEPGLVSQLSRGGRATHYAQGMRSLVHSRDARIVNAVLSGDALLSRLDGEWWVS